MLTFHSSRLTSPPFTAQYKLLKVQIVLPGIQHVTDIPGVEYTIAVMVTQYDTTSHIDRASAATLLVPEDNKKLRNLVEKTYLAKSGFGSLKPGKVLAVQAAPRVCAFLIFPILAVNFRAHIY